MHNRGDLVANVAEAYIYPASTLHCTICTFRAFTAGGVIRGLQMKVLQKAEKGRY